MTSQVFVCFFFHLSLHCRQHLLQIWKYVYNQWYKFTSFCKLPNDCYYIDLCHANKNLSHLPIKRPNSEKKTNKPKKFWCSFREILKTINHNLVNVKNKFYFVKIFYRLQNYLIKKQKDIYIWKSTWWLNSARITFTMTTYLCCQVCVCFS